MILNTISLHNFMSYADARVDLTSVSVACLAGPNGAGKSALLDAVTWALWETARGSSDELMRLGQKDMWVEICFELERQHYRVRRSRYKSSGKGGTRTLSKGTLELQIRNSPLSAEGDNHISAEASYTSLTAGSMKETQHRIYELLRMEYDTFVNSVYLRQGKADEFTTKAPAERKHVLGEILGLSYFDRLQEVSREQVRLLKNKAEVIEMSLLSLPEVESRLTEASISLDGHREKLTECLDKLAFYEGEMGRLKDEHQHLQLLEEKRGTGKLRLSELLAECESLRLRQSHLQDKQKEISGLLQQSPEIEAAAREFEGLKHRVYNLDQIALNLQDLNAKRLELQAQIATMRSRLEVELDHGQSKLKELEKSQSALNQAVSDIDKHESAYQQYRGLVSTEAEMAKRQDAFMQLTARSEELQGKIIEARIRLEAEAQQKQTARQELEEILESSAKIDEEKVSLYQQAEMLDKLELEFDLIEEKGLRVKSDLESNDSRIEELKRLQRENDEKSRELQEHSDGSLCPLCAAPIVDRAAVINRYRQQNESMSGQIMELEKNKEVLEAERIRLRREYSELRARLEGRKALDTKIGQFNEKVEAVARARASLDKSAREIEMLKSRLDSQDYAQVERESLVAVKAEMHKLDFDPTYYFNLQGQIRMQRHVEVRHQQLQKDVAELSKLNDEVPRWQAKVGELQTKMEAESFAVELSEQVARLKKEMEELFYDRQEHQLLKERLSALMPSSDLFRQLDQARIEAPSLEESISSCRHMLDGKTQQAIQLEADVLKWEEALDELPSLLAKIADLEPVLEENRTGKEELATKVGVLESRIQHLEEERSSLEKRRTELEDIRIQLDDYSFLSEAFGKKGIQAVIIENAVPEIESEANRILSRLSENQMHVALATQHKTKAGNVVETLDLLIGDELGTRNYELYSGGEAFKVDFSVRVALSRLLARRSGAKLETLIIDEGFGSQDELSRERLVRAINAIRDDFARILVITHISEVKEMFPVQVQVSKKGGVSQVQVLSL